MNPLHYPSLELCKKLTEAGFHNTNLAWFTNTHCNIKSWIMDCGEMDKFKRYVCPSIMELLDEMPSEINNGRMYELLVSKSSVSYMHDDDSFVYFIGTLPSTLAEMWLWLKENNYIPNE